MYESVEFPSEGANLRGRLFLSIRPVRSANCNRDECQLRDGHSTAGIEEVSTLTLNSPGLVPGAPGGRDGSLTR